MRSSVLVDRMPGASTINRGYGMSTYSSSYRPPSSSSYTRVTGVGSTPRKYASTFDSSSTSSYSSTSRPLPAGRGPLDSTGSKLSSFSVRTRTPTVRTGPIKADYSSSSIRDNDYTSYGTLSNRRTGISNHEIGTTSRLSGRRSASLANLNDLGDLHIGETSKYNTRNDRIYGTTSRRSSVSRDNDDDFLRAANGTTSRTSRISMSVDRENIDSPSYMSRASSRTRRLSRESSPVRERVMTPTRRYSTDARELSLSKSVSRQSSNSSLSGSSTKAVNGGKVGLRNLGNTCFMNSVIQCLSNTRPLLEYCLKDDYMLDINTSTSSMKGSVLKAYVNIMQSMWKDRMSDSFISPNSFKTQVQKFAPRFMGYAQQDSQEFLRYLLEGLHEDVNKVTQKPRPIVLDDDKLERKSDHEKSHEYWRAYLNFDNSKIVDIFVGQLKSELKFSQCGHRSVTFDPFWDLSLPIPKNRSEVSLDDCFRLFMREEELQDDPICTKCKQRRQCTKSFSIQKFPKILVIHLKRFSQEKFGRKLMTSVEYPTSNLDLADYASESGGSKVVYNLYAVSNHSGGVHSGHYTAICKHPYSGEWNYFNDTSVSTARSNQAVSSEGYLLFYEQVN